MPQICDISQTRKHFNILLFFIPLISSAIIQNAASRGRIEIRSSMICKLAHAPGGFPVTRVQLAAMCYVHTEHLNYTALTGPITAAQSGPGWLLNWQARTMALSAKSDQTWIWKLLNCVVCVSLYVSEIPRRVCVWYHMNVDGGFIHCVW